MNRFTYKICGGGLKYGITPKRFAEGMEQFAAYEDTGLTPEQVAAYAKAEAEGRMIMLPCKVGDMVWDTEGLTEEPTNHMVLAFDVLRSLNTMYLSGGQAIRIGELGKTVFLTREEAEAALKEVQG